MLTLPLLVCFGMFFLTNFRIQNYLKPSRPQTIPPKKKKIATENAINSITIFEILNKLNFPK